MVVAEGAGQEFMKSVSETDASGNKKLQDIGVFLRDAISVYMKKNEISNSVKYIIPS